MGLEELIEKVRAQCQERGAIGIRSIGVVFRNMDNDGSKSLNVEEFKYGLQDIGVKLSAEEFQELTSSFDKNGDGRVNFDEFLVALRGNLKGSRLALAHAAFKILDTDGSNEIVIQEIKNKYNCQGHPKVKAGEMTEEQVFQEFMKAFENQQADSKITLAEWEEYYAGISASIDTDEYFEEMMKSCWKM